MNFPSSTALSNMTAPQTPKQQNQISSEFECLDKVIASLGERVDALASKLNPIVAPQPAVPVNEKIQDNLLVPLAGAIREDRKRLEAIADRVSCLLDNIQL